MSSRIATAPDLQGRLLALNVGTVSSISNGARTIVSAYHKHPVDGPVPLGPLGFPGDEHVYEHHGGPDKAVCVYPQEHYRYWEQRLDLTLPESAAFGENFTLTGLLEVDVDLGDVYEIGEALVQVTQPRAPCYKIAARYGVPKMALYVQQEGMTGYHMRVLRTGLVQAGQGLTLVSRESHGISVAEANRILNHDKHDVAGALRLLDSVDLPSSLVPACAPASSGTASPRTWRGCLARTRLVRTHRNDARSGRNLAAAGSSISDTQRRENIMTVVRAAVTQVAWTGDKESMIVRHEELAREAAADGVQIIGFQELFYGPYFGAVQDQKYYQYVEPIPGPTTERFQALAKELNLVIVLPIYEVENDGEYYNTAAVIDADGTLLGKYRKHHIPHLPNFWEKFYFRPGNLGYPVFQTAVGRVGVYICYDRHFPEGWREFGLNNAQIVFNPSATKPGLSNRLWELEQPAAAAANQYFVAANNRIGQEIGEFGDDAPHFYGSSYFVDPRGNYVGEVASQDKEEIVTREIDLDLISEVRNDWQFYRDRRPDSYVKVTAP